MRRKLKNITRIVYIEKTEDDLLEEKITKKLDSYHPMIEIIGKHLVDKNKLDERFKKLEKPKKTEKEINDEYEFYVKHPYLAISGCGYKAHKKIKKL